MTSGRIPDRCWKLKGKLLECCGVERDKKGAEDSRG
jgi:hypothetical protein